MAGRKFYLLAPVEALNREFAAIITFGVFQKYGAGKVGSHRVLRAHVHDRRIRVKIVIHAFVVAAEHGKRVICRESRCGDFSMRAHGLQDLFTQLFARGIRHELEISFELSTRIAGSGVAIAKLPAFQCCGDRLGLRRAQ